MTVNKRMFVGTVALALSVGGTLSAAAGSVTDTNTWIGAVSDKMDDAGNWSLGVAPIWANKPNGTLRFTNSVEVLMEGHIICNHLLVEQGNVLISDSNGGAHSFIMQSTGLGSTRGCTSRVDVAENAVLRMKGVRSTVSGTWSLFCSGELWTGCRASIVKCGKGLFECDSMRFYGYNNGQNYGFHSLDVMEGTLAAFSTGRLLSPVLLTHNNLVRVHDGACLWMGYQQFEKTMVVQLDKGALMRDCYKNDWEGLGLAGVIGEGIVSNTSLSCGFYKGPYEFSGQFTKNGTIYASPQSTAVTSSAEFGMIVGATNTFEDAQFLTASAVESRVLESPAHCCVRFKPGIGFFKFSRLKLPSTHPLYLADTDGNAVTVRVTTVESPVWTGPLTAEGGRGCLQFAKTQTWNGTMGTRTDLGLASNVTVTLGADAVLDPDATLHLSTGSVLDLGGRNFTVSRVTGGGKWRNGKLHQTGIGMVLILR